MGRFYKSSKPQFLDFVYKQPNNLLLKAVEKAEQGIDKNLASVTDLYGRLKSEALKPDTERRDEIINSYKKEIDAMSQAIFQDPLSYRGYTPDIKTLSDDIADNIQRGELAAFSSNVKARQTYSDKLDAQVKSTGADHISREAANQLLQRYDADFKEREGTLYASPSAYQTYDSGYISGEIDVFEESDKILKGMAADKKAWASAGLEVQQNGDEHIVTRKGGDKEVTKEEVASILNRYLASSEKINQYYDTRKRENISGFGEGRKEYDFNNVLNFMAGKFGFKEEERSKSMSGSGHDIARKAWLRDKDISSTTSSETTGDVNSEFDASSGEEAFNKYSGIAATNTKTKASFKKSTWNALWSDMEIRKQYDIAPALDAQGNDVYIRLQDAQKNPDGSYKTGPEGNFLMKKGSKFASEEQKNKYLTALQESQKEIQDQYDQAYNTGKGWGELAESLEEKGYEDLAIFANKGSVERNTESVRQEQQYVNIRSYASELLGNGATKEDVDKLSQKMSLYKNNIIKSNNILDLTTQDNVQDKVLVAKWNRKSKDWEKDNERFTSKSTLVPRKYNDDGSPRAITSDDAMNGALELLMQNGNILFSQDAYKTIAGAFKVDPSKIQILGSGTPSETSTKIEFMVDGKEYALERGGLKFTYDKTTPKKISGSREGFYWTQQINLFEKPKKGEEGKAKQHVWDLVTRGEDWRAEIDGKSINELISNNQQRDSRIVSKKMAAAEQISKKLYQEKADRLPKGKVDNVKTPAYNLGYNLLGKDLNVFTEFDGNGTVYYALLKDGKRQQLTQEEVSLILQNDLATNVYK